MRKQLIVLATVALLGTSSMVMAEDLSVDMDTIAENYGQALKADNAADFTAALAKMKSAAEDAKKDTPAKLDGKAANSPEIKDYQHGLDVLIGQIDKAAELAKAGKLDQAKTEAQSFKATRDENHKKFR